MDTLIDLSGSLMLQDSTSSEKTVVNVDGETQVIEESAYGWEHWLKVGLICLKALVVSIMLVFAIVAYSRRQRKAKSHRVVIVLLVLNIFIMLGMLSLDVGKAYIPLFFIFCLLANFNSLVILWIILRDIELTDGNKMGYRYRWYFRTMILLYVAIAVAAVIPGVGKCTTTQIYPRVNSMLPILFMLNYLFSIYLRSKDSHSEEWCPLYLINNPICPSRNNFDEINLFRKQINTYICMQSIILIIQVGIQIIGRCSRHFTDLAIACISNGWEWEYLTFYGSLFCTFHIMVICMQTVMAEKILYSIPEHNGYFFDHKDCKKGQKCEHDKTEEEKAMPQPEQVSDDYKRSSDFL